MSLEAIKSITAAEEAARKAKADALQNAKKSVEEAEKAGRAAVDAAVARANDEIKHLLHAADTKAAANASELYESTSNRQASMRAHAETLIDQAAMFIAERIVNS